MLSRKHSNDYEATFEMNAFHRKISNTKSTINDRSTLKRAKTRIRGVTVLTKKEIES